MLRTLADLIVRQDVDRPVRVAIDGPDGAGKTTLADELAPLVQRLGRPAIRASIDGFHRPRAERLLRGDESPEGYYADSFDYDALRSVLLEPLGPGGTRRYRTAVFDHRTDAPVHGPQREAPPDAVLLPDAVFLLRPELVRSWDVRIFVSIPFDESVRRALVRDRSLFGSESAVRRRYERRYVPGQKLYLAIADPGHSADAIVENTDPAHPRLRLRHS